MIRVGIVGLGAMGQHHVRVYSELNCKIVGLVDVDDVRARQMAEKFGTDCYADYHELIGKVDAVSLAIPTSLHSAVACEFLQQGVHCLVEKPIASNLSEAMKMSEAANHTHTKLMVGHIERFNPAVMKLKALIEQGLLGRVVLISTRRVGPFVPRIQDVGIVLDSAIHDIDIVRYLMDRDPVFIYSKAGRKVNRTQDSAMIVLDFEDAAASVEVNWLTPVKVRTLVATGSEATCHLDYIKQELELFSKSGNRQVEVIKGEPLKIEIQHFLNCIENNISPLVDARAGIKALEVATLAAAGDGQRVSFAG